MPVYEFECTRCGAKHESLRDVALRDAPTVCFVCGGASRRLIGAPRMKLDWASGDFPGETHKWEREQTRRADKARANGTW